MAKTTVNLDDDLLRAAKKHAIDEGTTLGKLIERGLELAMTQQPRRPTTRRLPELTLVHGGSLLIDVADRRAIGEALDDPEWLARRSGVPEP